MKKFISLLLALIFLSAPDNLFADPLNSAAPAPLAPFSLPARGIYFHKYIPGSQGLIIHLQTVHGHHETERRILRLLSLLRKQEGLDLILAEGSAVPWNSRLINFLPEDSSAQQKILNLLARQGIVKAPELFLAKFPEAQVMGIENVNLYRANLQAYRKKQNQEKQILRFLHQQKQIIENKTAWLNPRLKEFLRREMQFEEQVLPLNSWLNILRKSSRENLGIDLASSLYQFDWPMLTRYFWLQAHPNYSSSKTQINQTMVKNDPVFELRFEELAEEIDRITEMLLTRFAVSKKEEKVFKEFKKFRLLKKLMELSLSRKEWETIQKHKAEFMAAIPREIFETAFFFYEKAVEREKAMGQNLKRLLRARSPRIAVLITGGFHTEEMERFVRENHFSYLLASPFIRESYEKSSYENLIKSTVATLETVPFMALNRAELRQHGIRPEALYQPFLRAVELAAVSNSARKERLEKIARNRWINSARSELRSHRPQFPPALKTELQFADRAVHHFPKGTHNPNDPYIEIQVLLAVLYGGSTMYYQKKSGHTSLEKIRGDYLQGLLKLSLGPAGSSRQQEEMKRLIAQSKDRLKKLGIRVDQAIRVPTMDSILNVKGMGISLDTPDELQEAAKLLSYRETTVGEVLAKDPVFENDFQHTFFGSPTQEGRLQKAIQAGGFDPSLEAYMGSFDEIFAVKFPEIKINASIQPFAVRVQHKTKPGKPYKGGIRYVYAWLLNADAKFKLLFDILVNAGFELPEMRYFVRKTAILEETKPLAFGMTGKGQNIKGSDNEEPFGGAKGAVFMADAYLNPETGSIEIKDHSSQYSGDRKKLADFVTAHYARTLYQYGFIGPDQDVPAPDMSSGSHEMDLMTEAVLRYYWDQINSRQKELLPKSLRQALALAYQTQSGLSLLPALKAFMSQNANGIIPREVFELFKLTGTFTGKSIANGGSEGRDEATGYGSVHVTKELLRGEVQKLGGEAQALTRILGREISSYDPDFPLRGLTAKILGFGNAGGWTVSQYLKEGGVVTTISEGIFGIVRKKNGFTDADIQWLKEVKRRDGNFLSFQESAEAFERNIELISEEEFLTEETDIYFTAAMQNLVHSENVEKLAAKVVVEIANGGITQPAYEILLKRGTLVFPDSIVNAGGVTTSYFEWLQNLNAEHWPRAVVIEKLEAQLTRAVHELVLLRSELESSTGLSLDWRTALDVKALQSYVNQANQAALPKIERLPSAPLRKNNRLAGARSELRYQTQEWVRALAQFDGRFVPTVLHQNPDHLREIAAGLFSLNPIQKNPFTWPDPASALEPPIPEPAFLKASFGIEQGDAFLIRRGFAFDYGALPVLRKMVGPSPLVVITDQAEDLAKIAAENEQLEKNHEPLILSASSIAQALKLIQANDPAQKPQRYLGIISVEDLKFMKGEKLKKDYYGIEWMIKTPSEFDRFLVKNHLMELVERFRVHDPFQTAA